MTQEVEDEMTQEEEEHVWWIIYMKIHICFCICTYIILFFVLFYVCLII
jgi:hypothetical protein